MKKLLICLMLFTQTGLAAISELKSYNDLDLTQIDQNTLVIFDIDNTLLLQNQMVGTHQWGDYLRDRAIRNGTDPKLAAEYQYKSFAELQAYVQVVPVETEVNRILAYLQSNKIAHFALTARASVLQEMTIKQLLSLDFNFTRHFPAQQDLSVVSEYLKEGVIFSGSRPKGELLKAIIDNSVVKPTKIIFIDDRQYNLESVEKSLNDTGLILQSYRYGGADATVTSFDSKIADIEFSFFQESKILLSDSDTRSLLSSIEQIANVRFDHFLADQGPLVHKANDCEEVTALIFSCEYFNYDVADDDQRAITINFEFKKDTLNENIYFGSW